MADLITHHFESKPIRVIADEACDPWFVAADVCRVLELADVTSSLRVLDEDEKGPLTVRTLGGDQLVNCISEPGLYKLMARSRKPEARRFDRWVRHEVLPEIRRTGSYAAPATAMTREQIMAQALLFADETMKRQAEQIAELAPKAEALDRLSAAEGSLCITDAAKALHVRPKDLFTFLQRNAWIYRRAGCGSFLGYSSKTISGFLEHRVTPIGHVNGADRVREQVLVTPKGLTRLAALIKPLAVAA